jgi:DNA-binding transcriptional regulator YdaS (Cro superfamily)
MYMDQLKQAIDTVGLSRLAADLNVSVQRLSNWQARGVPIDQCPRLERESPARFVCEQLRPDVRWVRVPDAGWPHPGGRPLIDVAGDVQSAAQPGEACNAG